MNKLVINVTSRISEMDEVENGRLASIIDKDDAQKEIKIEDCKFQLLVNIVICRFRLGKNLDYHAITYYNSYSGNERLQICDDL